MALTAEAPLAPAATHTPTFWQGLYENRETLKQTLRAVWSAARGRDPEAVNLADLTTVIEEVTPTADHARAFAEVTEGCVANFATSDGGFILPPTYASTWGMRLVCRAFAAARIKLPVAKVLHAGNRVRFEHHAKAGETLRVATRLKELDRTERRTIVTAELVHTRLSGEHLFTVEMVMFFPGEPPSPAERGSAPRKDKPRVPFGAEAIGGFQPTLGSARRYTAVSGDFNPIHVSDLAAKASGFPRAFLHGYATKAIALNTVVATACGGDPTRLRAADVRFTKPLLTRTETQIFLADPVCGAGETTYTLAVGPGPGEAAVLLGTVTIRT